MDGKTAARIAAVALFALLLGTLVVPPSAEAQTQGMQRRQDRRGDRGAARTTRHEGREDARAGKHECIAGDEKSRAECRQQKRGMKQGSRQKAREQKYSD